MSVYLQFKKDGLVYIPGDSQDSGHEGWVNALSLNLPPPPAPSADQGSGSDLPPLPAIILSITKTSDSASPKLMMAAHDGTLMEITIDLTVSVDRTDKTYLTYYAIEAAIVDLTHSPGTDNPTETLTINCKRLTGDIAGQGPDLSGQLPPAYYGGASPIY